MKKHFSARITFGFMPLWFRIEPQNIPRFILTIPYNSN